MTESRERILRMLADGAITPEQAEQLLDALQGEAAASAGPRRHRVVHREIRETPEALAPEALPDAARVAEELADIGPRIAERLSDLGPRIAERVASATRGAAWAPRPPRPPIPPRPPRPARAPRPPAAEQFIKVRRHKHRRGARFDQLVELASLGIGPEKVKEFRAIVPDVSLEEVMELSLLGISADTVGAMREAAPELSVEEIAELATLGVVPEYAAAVREALGPDVTADRIMELWVVGVSADQLAQWGEQETEQERGE